MAKLYTKTLKNGLRYYAMPTQGTNAATIYVVYQVGSRYETDDISGISHFLEHMMFKGTKKRPGARAVVREMDSLGAEYNAFTSKDWTGYYIKSAKEHFDKGLDIMSDVLLNSTFAPAAVKRESTVILEEIRMYQDNPLFHIEDLFEQTTFGRTPLGREIAGTKKTVLATTSAKLRKYWETYYHPRNMVVVVTGAVNPKAVEQKVNKLFGKMKPQQRLPYFTCRYNQKEPQLALVSKDTEQTQIALGFHGYNYTHPKLAVLDVMHGVLGSGMSSRLFETIREKMGLAYSVRTSVVSYEDLGAFYVRAGLDSKKTGVAIKAILKELAKLKKTLVTAEELKRAKSFLTGNLALQLEESDAVAGWIAKQALFRPHMETTEDIIKKINAVTREQIRDVAQELFLAKKLNLSMIGPHKKTEPFEKLLAAFR